jgi:hypothetical protein
VGLPLAPSADLLFAALADPTRCEIVRPCGEDESREQMDQLVEMGMVVGLQQAAGRIDALLA